jgi:ribokinase
MGKIVVIGSSNTDMVVSSPKMPAPGETIIGGEFNVFPGGKGANQSVAAARANAEVIFIAKVGDDDFAKNSIKGYEADNINTDYIISDPVTPSGVAVIIVEEATGQNSIVVASGANNTLSIDEIKRCEKVIADANAVLVQLEIPLAVVEYSLRIAKQKGVRTILNPAPAQHLSETILGLVDIITPNESETYLLTGTKPENEDKIKEAATQLLEKVNEAVMITLGAKGVYYISKNGSSGMVPGIRVNAVDTTAAGDVFNGYLAAALANGKNYEEAIALANKAAAISVTRRGAQPSVPYIDEVDVSG